jgi:hypothetical protein
MIELTTALTVTRWLGSVGQICDQNPKVLADSAVIG